MSGRHTGRDLLPSYFTGEGNQHQVSRLHAEGVRIRGWGRGPVPGECAGGPAQPHEATRGPLTTSGLCLSPFTGPHAPDLWTRQWPLPAMGTPTAASPHLPTNAGLKGGKGAYPTPADDSAGILLAADL